MSEKIKKALEAIERDCNYLQHELLGDADAWDSIRQHLAVIRAEAAKQSSDLEWYKRYYRNDNADKGNSDGYNG